MYIICVIDAKCINALTSQISIQRARGWQYLAPSLSQLVLPNLLVKRWRRMVSVLAYIICCSLFFPCSGSLCPFCVPASKLGPLPRQLVESVLFKCILSDLNEWVHKGLHQAVESLTRAMNCCLEGAGTTSSWTDMKTICSTKQSIATFNYTTNSQV